MVRHWAVTSDDLGIEVWGKAINVATRILEDIARNAGKTGDPFQDGLITYGELAPRVNSDLDLPDPEKKFEAPTLDALLGEISNRSSKRFGFMLSALVVSKESRTPGGGFFDLARNELPEDLCHDFPQNPEGEHEFWQEQCHLVWEHYKRQK